MSNAKYVYNSATGHVNYIYEGIDGGVVLEVDQNIVTRAEFNIDTHRINPLDPHGDLIAIPEIPMGTFTAGKNQYSFSTMPIGTTIFFEGSEYKTTDPTFTLEMPFSGTYQIVAIADGYQPMVLNVQYDGIDSLNNDVVHQEYKTV